MKKYIFDEESRGDIFTTVLKAETKAEAIREAEAIYKHLSDHDKKDDVSAYVFYVELDEDDVPDYETAEEIANLKLELPATWYAVMRDLEDDWGDGSYDYAEAEKMARTGGYPLVAVITPGNDPICERIISID